MPRRSDALGASSFAEYSDHPLFPVEEGEANPQVTFIQITRHDRGVHKYGPVLKGEELTTSDQLFEMYGGGHYELWARGPSKMKPDGPGNITRKRRFVLPGRPKPLSKDPTPEELRESEGYRAPGEAAAPSPAPSSSAAGLGGDSNVLLAMMNMQQQNAQQFATMMMTMLQSSKAESTEMAKMQAAAQQQMTTMMLTLSSQNQASMMQFMTAMMAGKSGGAEEMAKYAKLLKDLGVGGAAATKDEAGEGEGGFGKMLEDAADFVQGIAQLKGSLPAGPGAPEPLPNGAPAPAGSAAAVAEAMLPKS